METTLKYRSKIVIEAIRPFLSRDRRVLDIGCGNGVVSQVLDFNDQEFDVGLFVDVLHHVPFDRQLALIQEARRVCRTVLLFEVKPTLIAKAVDHLIDQIHNPAMPLPLTHRSEQASMRLFDSHHIPAQFFPVRKPAFFYPSTNYLFSLHGSSK